MDVEGLAEEGASITNLGQYEAEVGEGGHFLKQV